jgi:hypothetical protein
MATLNFPDPNVQTSYTNPDTGITYEWNNDVWKSVRTAQTAPQLFVNAAGDNVTGNLTFGTDKIVLNATTGAATFASAVDATAFTINGIPIGGSSSQTIVSDTMPTPTNYNTGTLWWNSESSDTSLYVLYQDPTGPDGDPGGKYWIEASPAPDSIGFDGTHTGDSTFTGNMSVTGSASFAGGVTNISEMGAIGCNPGYADGSPRAGYYYLGNGDLMTGGGAFRAFTKTAGDSTAYWIDGTANGVKTFSVATNGSATFGGDVTVGNAPFGFTANGTQLQDNGGLWVSTDNPLNEIIYGGATGGEQTVSIRADGFAKFGGVNYSQTLYESGTLELYNKDWPNGSNALDIRGSGGSVAKILGDGSATFAGYAQFGSSTYGYRGILALNNDPSGTIYSRNHLSGGAVFEGASATGSHTSFIYENGSAEFAGGVQAGGNASSGSAVGTKLNSYGAVHATRNNGNEVVWQGNLVGQSSTSLIHADGSATFAGRIISGDGTQDQYGLTAYNNSVIRSTFFARNYEDTGLVFQAYNSSVETSSIKADGSATFAGDVKYGGFGYISEGDLGTLYSGSASGSYGIIIGTEPGSTSSSQRKISFCLGTGGASEVASIRPDGTGTFSSLVADATGGQVTAEYNLVTKLRSYNLGLFLGSTDPNNAQVSNSAASITNNGSAQFADTVKIGTTTDGAGAGFATKIAVSGGDASMFKTTGVGPRSAFPIRAWHDAAYGDNLLMGFAVGTYYVGVGSITYDRGSNVTLYNTTSDSRLKTNITDASSALSDLSQVRVRSFDWIEDGHDRVKYGFVAQELNNIAPYAVSEGDHKDEVIQEWGVSNSSMVPLLTKALQEAIAKIETLETEVAALKAS